MKGMSGSGDGAMVLGGNGLGRQWVGAAMDWNGNGVGEKLVTDYVDFFRVVLERKIIGRGSEKSSEKGIENQGKILDLMRGDRFITILRLSGLVGINEKNVKENLRKLNGRGVIRRIGFAKGGYWEVVKDG